MAENYILLETVHLTQSASSVTFDNIPQTGYTHLKLAISSRTNTVTGNWDNIYITFNGSTSGYSQKIIYGNGSAVQSDSGSSTSIRTVYSNTASQGSNHFSSNELVIPYYNSSQNKTASMHSAVEQNTTNGHLSIAAALWSNTSAITSITLTPPAYTFVEGSTFSLYGLATVGTTPVTAPKADGGNMVSTDGTYWYHTFLTSGNFVPRIPLTCDYLVVAGGGGSGYRTANDYYYCGGGGGGGLLTSVGSSGGGGSAGSPLSFASQTYPVIVGAGGATPASNGNGVNGNNSSISTITAIGGGGGAYVSGGANGIAGGSGGGASSDSFTQYYGGAGTSGQGYAGGNMETGNALGPGGGGGAGGVGGNGGAVSSGKGGTGGAALANSITGTSVYYAGGGAGGRGYYGSAAIGNDGTGYAVATSNRGMGGRPDSAANASGSSGIVIIRYAI